MPEVHTSLETNVPISQCEQGLDNQAKNFLVHACEQLSAQVGNSILSTCGM